MRKILFVSHEAAATQEAHHFKKLAENPELKVFLSSDCASIPDSKAWAGHTLNAICKCHYFAALITRHSATERPWMNFEIGAALGRPRASAIPAKVFVFGSVKIDRIASPIKEYLYVNTGNTGRLILALKQLGIVDVAKRKREFAALFRQVEPSRWAIPYDLSCL